MKPFLEKCCKYATAKTFLGGDILWVHLKDLEIYLKDTLIRRLFDVNVNPSSYIRGTKAPYEPDWKWYLLT